MFEHDKMFNVVTVVNSSSFFVFNYCMGFTAKNSSS